MKNTKFRIYGLILITITFAYFPWILINLNWKNPFISSFFLLGFILTTITMSITIINNWTKFVPKLIALPDGNEPKVCVLIPTLGEPVEMIEKTIGSVFLQDYPKEKIIVIVGDDSHRDSVREMVENVGRYLNVKIYYHEPPLRGSKDRFGNAKDGNLNSMLLFMLNNFAGIKYVETRDADDIVGDKHFLRYGIGKLNADKNISFVQTIKEAYVSDGDPFGNLQLVFYRGIMYARNAANAVFPCGSGVIWRKESLLEIGGFPTWNLVEDLYSGYVALQNGMKGIYLPIVGAIGQIAPEDIPNVYKQLGTWAMDTVRIFFWKNPIFVKGLNLRQKLQFLEQGFAYLGSYVLFAFMLLPVMLLNLDIKLFTTNNSLYVLIFILYTLIIELLLMQRLEKIPFFCHWRYRQMWVGMVFVYISAAFKALIYGPNKKPVYRVTRKNTIISWYWRETLPQTLMIITLLLSITDHILRYKNNLSNADFGSIAWAIIWIIFLFGIIEKSWYGVKFTFPTLNLNRFKIFIK